MARCRPYTSEWKGGSVNELALFAGAGGGILGGKLLGWRTVVSVEYSAFCARRLMQRQNEGHLAPFPVWDDVRTFDGYPWRGIVDVVSGGFPCQAYSSAAAGKNVADDLWPEMRRIVADVAPRYVFAENVQRRAIDRAAEDLEAMGYEVSCIGLSASNVGADHERERYWLRAYTDLYGELCGQVNAEMEVRARVRPRIWETYPDESRMVNGLAHRMDRLAATGNGQVPIVAATAWRLLEASSVNLATKET
jgi:DNA (cytosine-5)-methyltransferase 1